MECVPTARAVVVKADAPPAFNDTFPRLVVRSKNLMEPVGTPMPDCGATLAVNVTLWPMVIWFEEAVSNVVVATGVCVTTTLTALDTELLSLLSPPYEAVIGCVAAGNELVLNAATPLAFKVPVPRIVAPSRNVTVPVGTLLPDCGETVAVKVTLCPVLMAVAELARTVLVAEVMVTVTGCEVEPASSESPP